MKLPRPVSLLTGRLARIANSKGTVYYGLHCYPGVAHYRPPGEDPYTVFIGEETLRRMDPTFAGCPFYLDHVDDLPASVDEVRQEADGVVVESFFNAADGRHWCKFIVLSERAEKAIDAGYTLSNCYAPVKVGAGGKWTGVPYDQEILDGNYEHLALVKSPRYEDSAILTPGQFKQYNAEKEIELKRLANNKDEDTMPIKLFRRQPVTKIENAKDLEDVMVALKSGKELTIAQLVNMADDYEVKAKNAGDDMLVNMGDGKDALSVSDLRNKYNEMCATIDAAKKENEEDKEKTPPVENTEDDDDVTVENDDDDGDDDDDDDDDTLENEDDVAPPVAAKKKNAADPAARARAAAVTADKAKADAKAKAAKLRNASEATAPKVEAPVYHNGVDLGRQRYGSN